MFRIKDCHLDSLSPFPDPLPKNRNAAHNKARYQGKDGLVRFGWVLAGFKIRTAELDH